ncbi:subtilisin-like protein [Amniculicola lignicola CBS 123094]|uniref:Subtilisin-like protein n=1 Tax=Amniculicola lignicola CBS 123094 TaxID=1392246 RepID=A0A6A5WWH0_9PLEO|nr:subtilisin-like protein [Amniculicola lignicola CBS 123094]
MLFFQFLALPAVALALGKKPTTPQKPPPLPGKQSSVVKPKPVAATSSKAVFQSSSAVPSSAVPSLSSSRIIEVTTSSSATASKSSSASGGSSVTKPMPSSSASSQSISSSGSSWSSSSSSLSSYSSSSSGSSLSASSSSASTSSASSSSSSANAAATTICVVYPKKGTDNVAVKRVDSTLSSLAAANAKPTPAPTPVKGVPGKASNSKRATPAKPSASPSSSTQKMIQGDKNGLFKSDSGKYGLNFWRLGLTAVQMVELKKNKDIGYIAAAACGSKCFDPSAEIGVQENAGDDMTYLSWGNQQRGISEYQDRYFYDTSAGKDSTIYLIDTGANLDHPEFTTRIKKDKISVSGGKSAAQRARWLYTGMISPRLSTEDMRPHAFDFTPGDNAPKWHGTCMLSRMVGWRYGVAKRANTVIVKVPFVATPEEYLHGVYMVLQDVLATGAQKKVLNLSWYYYAHSHGIHQAWIDALYNNIKALHDLGVTIIAGSGNEGLSEVNGYPAVFASDAMGPMKLQNMIVVGAINPSTFERWLDIPGRSGSNVDIRWNNNILPHVYAPGTRANTFCADGMLGLPASHLYRGTVGTSPATAAVSGLAAYLAALHNLNSADIKARILDSAWVRNPSSPMGQAILTVWNGVTDAQLSTGSCVIMKRSFWGLGPRAEASGMCLAAPKKRHARDMPSVKW